jgi:CRISPR-associated protein Csx10
MTAPIAGTLDIALVSDWHVGTGAGRPGELDRLVARDADDLPYIPAKTLIGMWRDGCERIAFGLDNGAHGPWCDWLDEIFGDEPNRRAPGSAVAAPISAALSLRPARLHKSLRDRLRPLPTGDEEARARRERLRAGLTFAKPGVRIDPLTGRARDNFLRMEEMARGGITLHAPFELRATSGCGTEWTDEQRAAMSALLVAGASEVERLGGKRRRGAGRCRASVAGLMPFDETLLALFDKRAPARPAVHRTSPMADRIAAAPPGHGWRALPIALDLLTPVVAADATVGNVVESLDHIPGSLLLPVVARALRAGGVDVDPAAEIAAGNIIVLPATPCIGGERGLPVPFALHVPKRAEGLSGARNRLLQKDDPQNPRQARREGYVRAGAAGHPIAYCKLDLTVATHGTIDEEAQRPTQRVGGVFSYEAIPAGTTLRSEIRLRRGLAERLAPDWKDRLGEARLGRSKKDDYGQVRIRPAGEWEDLPRPDASRFERGAALYLWLLSDLLLRGDGLRQTLALQEELEKKLGAEGRLTVGERKDGGLLGADLRVRRHDGWQAQWGLPRPSLVGLRAGSCVRIVVTGGPVDRSRLAEIETEGLGERRAEGFGQVRFNDPLLTEKLQETADAAASGAHEEQRGSADNETADLPDGKITKDMPEYATAALIELAAWRKSITEAAAALALEPAERERIFGFRDNKPGPSQLGALRSHLIGLTRQPPDPKPIRDWLNRVEQNRADRWGLAGSLTKLQRLLSERGAIWAELDVAAQIDPLTADGRERLQDELWGEAVAAAIGAAMRAHILAARQTTREPTDA